MEEKLKEIKNQLKELREQNRTIATENLILSYSISKTKNEINLLSQQNQIQSEKLEKERNSSKAKIKEKISLKVKQRNEKRRNLLEIIQEKKETNKALSNEIRDLGSQLKELHGVQITHQTK